MYEASFCCLLNAVARDVLQMFEQELVDSEKALSLVGSNAEVLIEREL